MITITQSASEKLQTIMTEKNIAQHSLRVFVSDGGCSGMSYGMTFAQLPEATDKVLESEGIKVVIDPTSYPYLEGANIDYIDSLMGGGFRIENPNAVQSCSCGSSFKTKADEEGASCCSH